MAGMFGLPDAAMVSQMAQKEQVPKENRVAWAVSKGWPISLIALADKYDLLQQAKQVQSQMQAQGQQPPATVAQEIDAGLASLDNPQPQMPPQGMPPQGMPAAQPQMPTQGDASMPPQGMPPQGAAPMPPQGGPAPGMRRGGPVHRRGPRGLRSLHAGRMEEPKFAAGGILAFNGEDGSEVESDTPASDLDMMNKLSGSPATQPAPVRSSPSGGDQAPARPTKPMSTQDRIAAYLDSAKQQQANIQAHLDDLAKQQVFQGRVDPTLEEDRKRLLLLKTANEQDVEKDRWQSLVEMGLAMAESASKPRLPGEGNMLTDLTAGMRAGTNKLNAVNDAYKKAQAQLDKDIIQAEHLKFQAEETQRKDLYNAYKQKQADIYAAQKEVDTLNTTVQKEAANLGIQAQNADTAAKNAAAQLRDPAQVQMYNHILAGLQAEDKQKVAAGAKPTPIGILQSQAAKQTLTASVGVTAATNERKLTADIVEKANKAVEEQYGLGGPGTMSQEWKAAVATDRKNGNDVEKSKIKKRAYNEYIGNAMGDNTSDAEAAPSSGNVIKYDANGKRITG